MVRQQILIGDRLRLEVVAGAPRFICSCGHDLGSGLANFKELCKVKASPTSTIGQGYASFEVEMASQMCFREFFCPGCGTRLTTEIARVGDPYLWDFQPKLA